MRHTTRAGVAALALACGVALTAFGAAAQTTDPSQNAAPGVTMTPGAPAPINPTADQARALLQSLENFVTQSVSGPKPTVGASVSPDVKLQPMPPAAQQALPQAKDHHVAKTDDDTILIVDPVTRQVVGVIQEMDESTTTGTTPDSGSNNPASGKQ